MEDKQKPEHPTAERRDFLKAGAIGLAGGAMLAASLDPKTAMAQAAPATSTSFKYSRISREDAAVLLVDHQAGLFSLVRDIAPDQFKNNVLALADIAQYFKLPSVLTTSFEDGPNGPLMPELKERLPDAPFIPRPGQINAWDNEDFVKAVKATGRKQLIIAGIVTEVCVAFPALSALEEGYEVFVVTDASGTFNEITRHSAWQRMSDAGAQLMSWFGVACELHRDWRRDVEGLGKLFANHIPDYVNLMNSYSMRKSANPMSKAVP